MEAAAVIARGPLASRRRRDAATDPGVAFNDLGGPVVALCGLTGGAGTSTLALALARHAARNSASPILVTESAGANGLALHAGRSTPHSLASLADRAAHGDTTSDAYSELELGLRIVAAAHGTPVTDAPIGALLAQARDAHGMVVVDCGAAPSCSAALAAATHLVWVFPATPHGVATARLTIPAGRGTAVAIGRDPNALVSVRTIRRAIASRVDRLVLVPYSAQAARGQQGDDDTAHAVARLASVIRGRS